jgi:prolyl-tRNA synthetase
MSLVCESSAGFPHISPLLQRVIIRLKDSIRQLAERSGFTETALPIVSKVELLQRSGVYDRFASELGVLDAPFSDYCITATSVVPVLDYLQLGGL